MHQSRNHCVDDEREQHEAEAEEGKRKRLRLLDQWQGKEHIDHEAAPAAAISVSRSRMFVR